LLRVVAAVVVFVVAFLPTPAQGASACATAILRDWSQDGHVGPKYSPPCYEEAIDALPSDLRDYTNAEDVISRALTSAVRSNVKPIGTSRSSDDALPMPLLALAVASLVVLAAGAMGYLSRRRLAQADGQAGRRR
jgi:hypothetical protein